MRRTAEEDLTSVSENSGYRRFFAELKRRNVFKVAAVYGVTGFVVLQAVDLLAEGLSLPGVVLRVFTVLVLAGFPIAIVLAWAFETTPQGVRRTEPARAGEIDAIVSGSRRQRWPSGILALLGGIAIGAAGWWALGPAPSGTDDVVPDPDAPALSDPSVDSSFVGSLAVLPFENRSSDPDDAFFVDGIHDDILMQLSRVEGLKLISRTSSETYRDTDKPIREIARELGVRSVVEGGVQRSGDRILITVQLIDAATDDHLWAESYDEELTAGNVFDIQTDVARRIAAALEMRLTTVGLEGGARPPTSDLQAYELHSRAQQLLGRRTREDMERSVILFREAIARDSTYAAAWSGLSDAYSIMASWGFMRGDSAAVLAEAAVERALELDPLLPEAYASRGLVRAHAHRWPEAEADFRRAIELAPGLAMAHHWYAGLLTHLGRFDEGIAEVRRAAALDPLSGVIVTNVGLYHYFARRYDRALQTLERVVERHPDFSYPWMIRGEVLLALGRDFDAVRSLERGIQLAPGDHDWRLWLARAYGRMSREEEARELIERFTEGADPPTVARAWAGLGEYDLALRWLERGVRSMSPTMAELGVDPRFDVLRDDPRFQAVLVRLNLPTDLPRRP